MAMIIIPMDADNQNDPADIGRMIAAIDAAAGKRRAANSLVRETRLLIPNSALDAPLGEVVEAIREAHANVATVA